MRWHQGAEVRSHTPGLRALGPLAPRWKALPWDVPRHDEAMLGYRLLTDAAARSAVPLSIPICGASERGMKGRSESLQGHGRPLSEWQEYMPSVRDA